MSDTPKYNGYLKCFIDTETTGTDRKLNHLFQIAGAIADKNDKVLERFDFKFMPFSLEQAVNIVTAELGTLSGQYWNQRVVLRKEVRDELVATAKTAAQTAIQDAIREGVEAASADVTPERIKQRIDAQVKSIVDAEIKAGVSARLRAIAAIAAGIS